MNSSEPEEIPMPVRIQRKRTKGQPDHCHAAVLLRLAAGEEI